MAQELKHLIDAIQKDGIDKAEEEAQRILEDAQKKAREIVRQAEVKSQEIRTTAEKEAKEFEQRGIKEIQQAARDIIISVARDIENLFRRIASDTVKEAMTADVLKGILIKIGEAYFDESRRGKPSDLYLNEQDAPYIADLFRERFRRMLQDGLVIHASSKISKGFRICLKDQRFFHDFTDEAITDELCNFLQPRLEKILHEMISHKEGNE